MRNGVAILLCVCSLALTVHAGDPISATNYRELQVEGSFDPGLDYFNVYFLSDEEIAVSGLGRYIIWELTSLSEPPQQTEEGNGEIVGLSPDRSRFALFTPSREVEIWSTHPRERQSTIGQLTSMTWTHTAFAPDGDAFAVVNRWNEVDLWDLGAVEHLGVLRGLQSNVFDLAFSSDGSLLAGGGGKSSRDDQGVSLVCVWDVLTGELIASLPTDDLGDNHAITFTQDGTCLVSAGIFRILAWDTSTWERVYDSGPSHPGSYGMALSSDGSLLALAGDRRSVLLVGVDPLMRVWSLPTGREVLDVDFSPNGQRLAAACPGGSLKIWTVP